MYFVKLKEFISMKKEVTSTTNLHWVVYCEQLDAILQYQLFSGDQINQQQVHLLFL